MQLSGHSYDGADNRAGSICEEVVNRLGFADANTILYGREWQIWKMERILNLWRMGKPMFF